MSGKFDIVHVLDPLLLDSLSKRELYQLANELHKDTCLSEDVLSSLAKLDGEKELALAIVTAIDNHGNPGLGAALTLCLKRIGKHEVARIVECWFDPNEKQTVAWILLSWNDLLAHEQQIKEMTFLLTSKKLSLEHWLSDFCYFIASDDTDPELKAKAVEMLQTSMSDSEPSIADVGGFEFVSMGSAEAEPTQSFEIQPQNFDVNSTSSSDSKEIFVDAVSTPQAAPASEANNVALTEEEKKTQGDDSFVDTSKEFDDSPTKLVSEVMVSEDVEMADESSSIGVLSDSMETLDQTEDIDMNEDLVSPQNSTFEESKQAELVDNMEGQDTLVSMYQDVEQTLFPLMPMLQTCLNENDIKDLLKDLVSMENLTRATYDKLMDMKSDTVGMYLFHLISALREEANDTWRLSLLEGIEELEKQLLYDVIEQYFGESNTDLSWMLQNWDSLGTKKDELSVIAKKFQLADIKAEEKDHWLLRFIHAAMLAGQEPLKEIVISIHKMDDPLDQEQTTEKEEVLTTKSEQIDDVLNPVMPLLKSCMNGKEIIRLARDLSVLDYFSTSKFRQLRSMSTADNEDETLSSFVNFFKDDAKDDWEKALLKVISDRGHKILHDVIAYYFEKPETLAWFLQNWHLLQEEEEKMCLAAQKLEIPIDMSNKEVPWLLCYVNEVLKHGNDVLLKLVDLLSRPDVEPEEEEKTVSEKVDDMLNPLMPLLKSCMDGKEIVKLARNLTVTDSLSTGKFRQLRSILKEGGEDEAFSSFVILFKDDAKDDWEKAILNAIKERGQVILHNVVEYYFAKPAALHWFFQNWDVLQSRKNELMAVTQKLNFDIDVKEEEKTWLLCYINKVVELGDEALMQLATALTNPEAQMADEEPPREDARAPFWKDIDDTMTPLFVMLKHILGFQEFIDVVAEMFAAADDDNLHISRESINMLNASAQARHEYEVIYVQFLDCLKNDAKDGWKPAFVEALTNEGHVVLSEIITHHFYSPQTLVWFLQNWQDLLDRKLDVFKLAQDRNLYLKDSDKESIWLMYFINEVLKTGEESVQQIINALCKTGQSANEEPIKDETNPEQPQRTPDTNEDKAPFQEPSPAITESVSNPAEEVEKFFVPLIPLLVHRLQPERLFDAATKMCSKQDGNFSKESLERLTAVAKGGGCTYPDIITLFITLLKNDAKNTWKTSFVECMKIEGADALSFVVAKQAIETNTYVDWAFANWDRLEMGKALLIEIGFEKKLCRDLSLMEIPDGALQIVAEAWARGGDVLELFIKKFAEDFNAQIRAALQTPQTEEISREKAPFPDKKEASGPMAQDVEESLVPLIYLLTYCVPSETLIDIAKDFCAEKEESFSKDSLKQLKESVKGGDSYEDSVKLFIHLLKKDAKANWKQSFVNFLKDEDLETLHFVVSRQFAHPSKFVRWVFLNWKMLESNKARLIQIAFTGSLCGDLSLERKPDGVLQIVRIAMEKGDDIVRWLMTKISQSVFAQKEATPQLPANSAITKEKLLTPPGPVTRSQTRKLVENLHGQIDDSLSKQVKEKIQGQAKAEVDGKTNEDTPPVPPRRNASLAAKAAHEKRDASSGEPSLSENEKDTSLSSTGSEGEPLRWKEELNNKPQGPKSRPLNQKKEDKFGDARAELEPAVKEKKTGVLGQKPGSKTNTEKAKAANGDQKIQNTAGTKQDNKQPTFAQIAGRGKPLAQGKGPIKQPGKPAAQPADPHHLAKNQLPPAADVSVKRKNIVDEDFSHARLKKIPDGKCVVEFRARLADPTHFIPEGKTLMLYVDNADDKGSYPMQFHAKHMEFRLALILSTRHSLAYKYFLGNTWEYLFVSRPYANDGIINRSWLLSDEQKRSRYTVTFDVVGLKHYESNVYINIWERTFGQFLQCEIDFSDNTGNKHTLMLMHYIYRNWFINLHFGMITKKVGQNYYTPSRTTIHTLKKETKVNAVINFLGRLMNMKDNVVRVLCVVAFASALNEEVQLENDILYKLCRCLSIHAIDDEGHALLVNHLRWFSELWESFKKAFAYATTTLLGTIEKLFKTLSKIPESVLVLPLLKVLQTLSIGNADHTKPPNLVSKKGFIKPDWNTKHSQNVILALGEWMIVLTQSFPWMQQVYSKMLTIDTTAEILNQKSTLLPLITVNTAFEKLTEYWNGVTAVKYTTPDFNENVASALIGMIVSKVSEASNDQKMLENGKLAEQWIMYCEGLLKSVEEYVANHSRQCNVGCVAFMLTLFDHLIVFAQAVRKNNDSENLSIRLEQFALNVMQGTERFFGSEVGTTKLSEVEVQLWNMLCTYEWTSDSIKEHWKVNCEAAMEQSLAKRFLYVEELLNFYGNKFEVMKPDEMLTKCFTNVLTRKIEADIDKSAHWYEGWFTARPKLVNVMYQIFKKKWKALREKYKKLEMREILLVFFDQWPPAAFFLGKLCEGLKTSNKKFFTDKQRKSLREIFDYVIELVLALELGNITVPHVVMLGNVEKYWKTYDAILQLSVGSDEQESNVDFRTYSEKQYKDLLKLRMSEMKAFQSVKRNLEEFVKFANEMKKEGISINCLKITQRLEGNALMKSDLCELVRCKKFPSKITDHEVICFPLNPNELQMIESIMDSNCLNSVYVKMVIYATALKCGTTELDINSFREKVWAPAHAIVLATASELYEGSITFEKINLLLEPNASPKPAYVKQQVQIMTDLLQKAGTDTVNIMDLRSEQIQNYLTVQRQQKTAHVLLEIKRKLKLEGNFDAIKTPLTVNGNLNTITEDTIKAVSYLENITQENLDHLTAFQEGSLLTWVKKHTKDLGEVKVMSDLAMISAGEEPIEVDRVSCFLSAVMGFSPLIYDLPQTAGLKELLKACKQVWENIERDESLVQKWVDTGKQMEWLKTVNHGSVEKSSLALAQRINKRGMYIVGKETEKIPTVKNCLILQIRTNKSSENEDVTEMSLSDLHDLQSRLMLIAGEAEKGKDDVTRFVEVLSSAENLAKAYVNLKLSGCLLFNDWFAVLRCRKEYTGRRSTIEVYFDEKSSQLASKQNVLQEIKELTDILQDAHNKWMDYLFQKRNEHYHLNQFNIRQLTYLCKKLSRVQGTDFPDQVYQLLAGVASNLSYSNISDCLEEVTKINDDQDQGDKSIVQDDSRSETKLERKKRVIRKLVHQFEIFENIAKAAVQCVPSIDVDECYLWALEHTNDEDIIAEHEKSFDDEVAFDSSNTDINAIQDVISDRLNLTLEEVINRIQSDLEGRHDEGIAVAVKTVCERYFTGTAVTSLQDCISLEHLGQFLTMLTHNFSDETRLPKRECPEGFHQGKPNLVVCPEVDMWRTILSIYMTSSDQGLPSSAEVLVCSESTTKEEVELLLRRAIQFPVDNGKRIFCLACADKIDFGVAKDAETLFQQLNQMSDKNNKFRLVVLATSLQHYITGLFDEYRVDLTFLADTQEIKQYICDNLTTKNMKCDTAAVIDHNLNLVRLICSDKAGMGKSLLVKRRHEKLSQKFQDTVHWNFSTIRFLEKNVDVDDTIDTLTHSHGQEVANAEPHFIHIDITPAVQNGVHKFLFDLILLGELKSSDGVIWRRCHQHFYALEYTFPSTQGVASFSNLLELLPKITCLSPVQVMDYVTEHGNQTKPDDCILMDEILLMSEMYQRPYQYLYRYAQKLDLDKFTYTTPTPDPLACLQTMWKYCSIEDPSWSELSHFSKFLNTQLHDCERSYFLNMENIEGFGQREAELYYRIFGFKEFVVRFMIRMSQDFATPSLQMNEEDPEKSDNENDMFELHQLRRRWENDFHPYLFFNADRISFSFVHFNISDEGDLCHPKTDEVVLKGIMNPQLVEDLTRHYKVEVRQDFDDLSRREKLETLCNVLGVFNVFDPDPSYELTTDNVLKMLAIHMRFRCGIPVVIMGETGCGKTRMVEFMSRLKRGGDEDIKNMKVVKVHGGVTVAYIQDLVKEAVTLARENAEKDLETILFLDEANTTEAIYAIKEIVCDATVHGEPFAETGLKIVAACNPYRKHDDDMIERMEQSGLGFHVKTEDVNETFDGVIPMRNLVYRVIPLPPSMQPLVWDFGQLNDDTEAIYIKQMVLKLQDDIKEDDSLDDIRPEIVKIITKCLSVSQKYMREERDVCSFVSLRDVERTITTLKWFYKQLPLLTPHIKHEKSKVLKAKKDFPAAIQALMHALGVCYHVTLDDREKYRDVIARQLQVTQEDILDEISACQNVFINAIDLEKDIGRNEALTENVFMVVVCAELRIPLFLVGKPGSSKSLAKTIVTDAMQGRNSKHDLFKKLKQIHVSSFQCSAVSDAAGIELVFKQCAQLQKNQSLDEFVAVVVLDEIGLAEDSPKMPLKVLHPLLESASTNTDLAEKPHSKVGFVGISNWALDPAKMNRGIFVTRGKPSQGDLQKTAEAIFESDKAKIQQVSPGVITALTTAYLRIYKEQKKEFFGLRDYYGLLKMLFALVSDKNEVFFGEIARLVLRNFSGLGTDAFEIFRQNLVGYFDIMYDVRVPVTELIQENLTSNFESRFLLLLTNQYAAVSLLPKVMGDIQEYQVIFGSSFPRDNDYTEVCRNINRIKVCMETGRTVVLLNLRDLYESLYDALNQHYVTFAGQRYVDLGLGGHRVKCRISKKFRLIVIEEKDVVYEKFPIPLINRLEKHVFEMNSVLTDHQTYQVNQLREWVARFTTFRRKYSLPRFAKEDTFPGYTNDTPASAFVSSQNSDFEETKKILLQTASLDGICRLPQVLLTQEEAKSHISVYMDEQNHDTLLGLLQVELRNSTMLKVFEITSFSQILHDRDRLAFERELKLNPHSIMLLTLQQFQTERSFSERLDMFFESVASSPNSRYILLIQCPQAQLHGNLIACAKYATMNKVKDFQQKSVKCAQVLVLFLFTMERNIIAQNGKASFTSFHSPNCDSLYIDELKPSRNYIAPVSYLWNLTVPTLILHALDDIGPQNPVLDLERLVRNCIPEAIAKLKNDGHALARNRIRILNHLCFESAVSTSFLKILGEHLWHLMRHRERIEREKESWIVEVACSPQALQEAGSFRNAVWLFLRELTAIAIARVVSVVDADSNLDIAEDPVVNELWLQIFDCPTVFALHWPESRVAQTFYVKTQFSCSFPFFRLFVEHLHKQWVIVQERNVDDKRAGILKSMPVKSLSLLELVAGKSAIAFCKRFIHDLVCYFYKSRLNGKELAEEQVAVESCVFNMFQALRNKNLADNNAVVEIYILYKEIQTNLQRFSSIVAVSTDILKDKQNWIDEQLNHIEFVADKLALSSLVKKLNDEAPKSIEGVDTCEKWKSLVNKAKPVAYSLVPECREEVQQMWTGIAFVEIFLDQLVPTSASNEVVQKYLVTIAPNARRLSIGARKFLSNIQFLNIVTKALEGCIKEIETKLLCEWQDIKCRSCKANRMIDPVMLPCKHHVCHKCTPAQKAADRSCPKCRTKIPDDYELNPVTLSGDQVDELKRFQSACISFFLEYLSRFCFVQKPLVQVEEKTLEMILERLVICDRRVKNDPGVVSDFGLDFVARSYILQLLIKSNHVYIENLFNNHLQALRNDFRDKAVLFDVFMHCDRNMLQREIESIDDNDDDGIDEIQSAFDIFDDCLDVDADSFNQLQHLDCCVKMQYIVQATVLSVHALHGDAEPSLHAKELMSNLVSKVGLLCEDEKFDAVQRAIVKELCQKYGLDAFNILTENNQFMKLIPRYLLPDEDENQGEVNLYLESDMLVLSGSSYQNTKNSLQNITKPADFPDVFQVIVHEIQQSPDSIFQILLALSMWTGKGAIGRALRRETFKHLTDRLQTHFAGKSYQQTFSDIAENRFFCPKHDGMTDQMHHKLSELLIVFCLTVLWHGDGILADMAGLMNDPKQFATAFLPTMPASGYFQVKDLLANDVGAYGVAPKAFLCPNGHLYFIGDCTRANQSAVCPDCRQPIGGQSYDKLHAGNVAGDITEESQAGYKLKPAKEQPSATPERSLSKLSVSALRFCLHAAMLLGSRNGNVVQQMIGNQNPSTFVVQHMIKDLTDMSQFLGRSVDDTILIMHEIFRRMRVSTIPVDARICNLKSMKAREMWEKEFQRQYLIMAFKDADNIINKAQTVLVNAGNMTDKPLESLVYELDVDDTLPLGIVNWDSPCLWKSRKHIDINHLNQKLEAIDASAGGEGATLKTILNMEELHLVQYLDVILDLQSIVMGRYRQKIDLADADEKTLNDFLDDDNFFSEEKVALYVKIWNKVRYSLAKCPTYKPLLKYFDDDMTLDSPIAMCIPSKRGRGRCAYVLVEYLIGKQNDILHQCRDHIKPRPSFAQVDVPKLTKRDIISISKKKDLLPLIQANHQYETVADDTGSRQKIIYDFGLLEKKVVEKFILRKAEIRCETVPLMQYPQDVGFSKDCDAVERAIKQLPLPVRMCHDLDTFVENARTANICEAVRTVTIVIQFLAKLGAEGDQTICDYSGRELLLPAEEIEMIPHSALISHCLALYERLSWHRSKRLIQNGQNPFENVLECARNIEDEELINDLMEVMKGMNIERLQLELNAVMMVGPEMQPDWRLGSEVLLNYLDCKHDQADNSWCKKLPDEILYKHAAHVFELSMKLVDN